MRNFFYLIAENLESRRLKLLNINHFELLNEFFNNIQN